MLGLTATQPTCRNRSSAYNVVVFLVYMAQKAVLHTCKSSAPAIKERVEVSGKLAFRVSWGLPSKESGQPGVAASMCGADALSHLPPEFRPEAGDKLACELHLSVGSLGSRQRSLDKTELLTPNKGTARLCTCGAPPKRQRTAWTRNVFLYGKMVPHFKRLQAGSYSGF